MSEVVHGGRLDQAIERHGGDRAKWLDLSTGINPVPWPIPEVSKEAWTQLPDQSAISACRASAREHWHLVEQAHVSLAPGSQMHLQVLPFLFKPQPVAVVGFTYQEHGVCWARAGHSVYVTDGLESAEASARIVVIVNPNNPDGRIADGAELTALARRLAAKGGLLVVDEAFADVTPGASIAGEAGREGLLVLRSLGKFFGLAGARVGFALCSKTLGHRLDDSLGPWAVSGPALEIATKALADVRWQTAARKKLAARREQLETTLFDGGLDVVGGTDLFVLARHDLALALAEHLAADRILVRSFPGKPDWLRFGLPATKPALSRLGKSLRSFQSAG